MGAALPLREHGYVGRGTTGGIYASPTHTHAAITNQRRRKRSSQSEPVNAEALGVAHPASAHRTCHLVAPSRKVRGILTQV